MPYPPTIVVIVVVVVKMTTSTRVNPRPVTTLIAIGKVDANSG